MKLDVINQDGVKIAVVGGDQVVIEDVQSGLDLMATVSYEAGCDRIIIPKQLVSDRFFDLKTRVAGEILQKFVQYGVRVAIVGDFAEYTSRSLHDFMFECNQGDTILFVPSVQQAVERWSQAQ